MKEWKVFILKMQSFVFIQNFFVISKDNLPLYNERIDIISKRFTMNQIILISFLDL